MNDLSHWKKPAIDLEMVQQWKIKKSLKKKQFGSQSVSQGF